MKKLTTTYLVSNTSGIYIAVSEEISDHISVYEGIEPCSGILRYWGSKKQLIKELESIIKAINEV